MILTCPECATSYFVDDARIPAQGRRVRCSSCAHRWLAGPDGPIPEPGLAPEPAPQMAEPEAEAAPVADEVVAIEREPAPAFRPLPLPRTPPPRQERRGAALVWAGVAGLVVALIAGVIVFREQVVRLWPASSAAYAGLGFQVAGGGLVLEQVRVQPAFLAGRPVLSISGAIRNIRDVPVEAPPVRLTLLNRAGQPVAAKIARPDDATIPAGARKRFTVTMLDPPATARDLEVRFDTPGGKAGARPAEAVLTPAPALPQPAVAAPPTTPAAATPAEAVPSPGERGQLTPAEATEHG
ncbi:MAG TPA: DUF3426 domain-containing protein [Phenylobacterium sp.]|uniref:DUF3426 domain-containing protein n=1 Tax=Phenylobacterium sp. TaxID=1871053 RepID=UPI002B498DE9|nr:DUF3426 domain-containing protein [Phenylobacterium sp.]HKR88325.1 DUF3426 domain-containing protein [Phenylobacterium sp.]